MVRRANVKKAVVVGRLYPVSRNMLLLVATAPLHALLFTPSMFFALMPRRRVPETHPCGFLPACFAEMM